MTTFAKLRAQQSGPAMVECIHNREIERPAAMNQLFFVLSEEVHRKYGIDYQLGEMLIYSPGFEPEFTCMWVACADDFELLDF